MERILAAVTCLALLLFSVMAEAVLIDRGGGLIYDTELNITWLQNANHAYTSGYWDSLSNTDPSFPGAMNWHDAVDWADQLEYRGLTNWRLPDAHNQDGSGPDMGFNVTGSELGYMYYNNLGGTAHGPMPDPTPFQNLQHGYYWTGTYHPFPDYAWANHMGEGNQNFYFPDNNFYAWAVRDGDVGPIPPALVGYWKFDETNGSIALDSSAFGNNGEIEGASPATGKCGGALYFDAGLVGGVDYVVVPNSDSINTSTFTVSFWVSISDLDVSMVFLHKRNGQWWRNFQLSYNANNDEPTGKKKDYLRIKIDDDGTPSNDFDNAAYAEVNLDSGKFYYIAATYDQSYLRLFLNGSPIAQIAEFPIDMTDNVGDGDLYIGTHSAQHPTMNPTNGIIDEVRIYNYALTKKQIQADMEACAPLTALSGCINVNGMPLADKDVTLQQQGGPKLTTMTDSEGCYEFEADVGKKVKIEFEGP